MIIKFCKDFYKSIRDLIHHDGVEHAGYMAFLSVVSLFPFIVFMMALAGFIGQKAVGSKLGELLIANLPDNAATILAPRVKEIIAGPPQGLLTIAIVGAIWTASASVEGMRTALNRAYRVKTPPAYIWRRLNSIGQFLILSILLTLLIVLLIFLPAILAKLPTLNIGLTWKHIEAVSFLGMAMLIVSWLYFMIPNLKIKFINVLPGAALVSLGWYSLGKLLSIYFRSFEQFNLIYGSIKGVIFSLFFFYCLHLIFIFGAEFNYHWQHHKTKK